MYNLKKKAFTLIELIVVIVILGLLAALAIPTFKGVIDRAKLETDLASLSAQARTQIANAAFEQGVFSSETVEKAIAETNNWAPVAGAPTKFGEINYSINGDSLSLVTRSSDGTLCLTSVVSGTSNSTSSAPYASGSCLASNVPSVPPVVDPPTPEEPALPAMEFTTLSVQSQGSSGAVTVTGMWKRVDGATSYEFSGSGLETKTTNGIWSQINITQPGTHEFSVKALNADGETITQVLTSGPKDILTGGPVQGLSKSGNVPPPSNDPALTPVRVIWSWSGANDVSYNVYKDGVLLGNTSNKEFPTYAAAGERFTVKVLSAEGKESYASGYTMLTETGGTTSGGSGVSLLS